MNSIVLVNVQHVAVEHAQERGIRLAFRQRKCRYKGKRARRVMSLDASLSMMRRVSAVRGLRINQRR